MIEKKTFAGVDRFRLVAALLVVAIHTAPLTSYTIIGDFVLTRIIGRVAVPFFFMTTGYFVLSKPERARGFLVKTSRLYLICIALYLPVNIYAGHMDGLSISGLIISVLFEGTFYHLWYLPAAIIGVCIVAPFIKSNKSHLCAVVVSLLYIVGLLGDSYYGLVENVPALKAVFDPLLRVMGGYTRNGIFLAPMYLFLGYVLTKKPAKRYPAGLGLVISLAVMIFEGLMLRKLRFQLHDSMYILLPAVMYFLFSLLLAVPGKSGRSLSNFAMLIYVLHPIMIILVRGGARVLGLWEIFVDNSLGHYLAVCAASIVSSALLCLVWEKIRPMSASVKGRAWLECDAGALLHNAQVLSDILPEGCELMPVIKADAYGHGADDAGRILSNAGIHNYAVATVSEAVALRKQGLKGIILVLGYTAPQDFRLLSRYKITQTVLDHFYAQQLSGVRGSVQVHIKVDTGMHRLGEDWQHVDDIAGIFSLPHLKVTGIYTHLSVSDSNDADDKEYTKHQLEHFLETVNRLRQMGLDPGATHVHSSYGIINYPDVECKFARVGIALYGVMSSVDDHPNFWPDLSPVLSLRARVAQVRTAHAGDTIGYGRDFEAHEDISLAIIAIGYCDGVPRALSDGVGCALINGKRAPIVGRVCMDQLTVNVSGLGEVKPGDIATLIGRDGESEIRCEELAAGCGTLTNEILSRLGKRLPKLWLNR